MNDKPNITPIQAYASQYASAICGNFFEDNDTINGQQIVSLANVHQVNLMVVKNIFQKWQKETEKLKSPYFNYEAEEVNEALNLFMNILSKNISIKEEDFKPLLDQSTQDTLFLLIYPGYFFKQLITQFDKKINLDEELFPLFKYIRIHTGFINTFKENLQQEGEIIKRKKALKILDHLTEQQVGQPAHIDEVLQAFDEEIPINAFDFKASWGTSADTDEEEDGLETLDTTDLAESHFDESGNDDDTLSEEIANEFEQTFLEGILDVKDEDEEEDDEEVEDEVYIADHLKSSLDPVNDNVFISNQEDILNAAIIEDFEFDEAPEEAKPENREEVSSTVYDPDLLSSENPFASATNDLQATEYAEEDDLPLHFDDSEEDTLADDSNSLFSLETEQDTPAEENTQESLQIEEDNTHTPFSAEQEPHEQQDAKEVTTEDGSSDQDSEPSDNKEEDEETLHDLLAKKATQEDTPKTTLLDKLKANNIKKLEGSIPLHLKFKFQNDLFGGDADVFNQAIELIDQAPDYHEALALVKSRFVLKYDWDFSNETTLEFIGMIEDKYD